MANFKTRLQELVASVTKKKEGTAPAAPAATSGAKDSGGGALALAFPKDVKKRWMLIGGLLAIAVAAIGMMSTSTPQQDAPRKRNAKLDDRMVDLTPKGLDKKSWQAQSMAEIEQLKQLVQRQARDNERLSKELGEHSDRLKEVETKATQEAKEAKANGLPVGITPPPLPKGVQLPSAVTPSQQVPGQYPQQGQLQQGQQPGYPMPGVPEVPQDTPTISKPEKRASTGETKESLANEPVKAQVTYAATNNAGMLPPGAFASIALLHGLDAATGTSAQANPMPVLLNVQEHATLPGSAKYALKSCFVLGSSFGDLSSERVYVQLSRLSCVDKADRLILSSEVQGYVVDSDGRLGLRGTLTDRQGSRLAKAMLAGFAQGLAGALKMSQGSVSTSALGSVQSMNGMDALRSAGLQGAADANTQLAQFYLAEAKQMFPVLSVDSGRTGTIVFQSPVSLKWGTQDAQFEQKVKPVNK